MERLTMGKLPQKKYSVLGHQDATEALLEEIVIEENRNTKNNYKIKCNSKIRTLSTLSGYKGP
jgi:hypothetical protein